MKAVVYEGTRRVGVHEVEDATLEDPADVVVRVTSSATPSPPWFPVRRSPRGFRRQVKHADQPRARAHQTQQHPDGGRLASTIRPTRSADAEVTQGQG